MKNKLMLMLISVMGLCLQTSAQGNLLITPMRVVFEGNKQKTELNLANVGAETATYSISFKQYSMTEEGRLKAIEKPDSVQMSAEPYLRIFPRRVTLAPGEAQVVMLQYRRKKEMQAGEYRSHLWFRSEKNYEVLGKGEKPKLDSNQLSVTITPIFGITIPVIIRTGEVNASATLSNLKLESKQDTIPYLNLTINRTGNISIYGNITVEYSPIKGKSYQIGVVKGVGVYTNINKRALAIKLTKTHGLTLKSGMLKVKYASPDGSKYMVYAEGELELSEKR
jgi:hypothetical protein